MSLDKLLKKPDGIQGKAAPGSGKFCKEVADKIVQGLEKGYTRKMVAEAVGVNVKTMRGWINSDQPKHRGFKERVLKAEALGRQSLVDMITFHGEKDWRASAWLLERTRAEFSQKAKTSQEARDELDRLAVEKAQAEVDYIRHKSDALQKNTLSPEQILELLNDSRKAAQADPSTEH